MKASLEFYVLIFTLTMMALFMTAAGSFGEETTVFGTVTAVDADNSTLKVKEDKTGKELSFSIDPESIIIQKGGEQISLANIQVGDLVVIK